MTEINGLDERISELKILYQEAERLNLKDKAIELLVDINYLEELKELRRKQEPCEDVVSRKTIDQNIYDYAESNELSYANLKNAILDAPSVTPTQKWIPVSKRLPKDGELVIVSYPYDASDLSRKRVLTAWYNTNYGFTCGIIDAWMPLPQPYKTERG